MFEIITAKKPQEAQELTSIVKQTSLVLATVLLASLLTACGGGSSSSDNNNGGGSTQVDTDNDGVADTTDNDDDNDGVADADDAFPLNAAESVDTDGDGTGNNADTDDDNDGVADSSDAFPLNAAESVDTDGDGTGNNADTDDDGDGILDADDSDPLNPPKSGFSKLSATGTVLADSAKEWSCVKDNTTGLIWEAKTNDDGLHDKDWMYSYGAKGTGELSGEKCKGTDTCDTGAYIAAVNTEKLCGLSDWRLPKLTKANHEAGTLGEYAGIINTQYDPTVNPTYFPNTVKYGTTSGNYTSEGYCTSLGTTGSATGVSLIKDGYPYSQTGYSCNVRLVSGTAQ